MWKLVNAQRWNTRHHIWGRFLFCNNKEKEKKGCVSFDSECYKKVSNGYKFVGSFDVGAENISGMGDILWHVNGTKDYYLSGDKWSDNAEDTIEVSDNLGTQFIQERGK